MQEIWKPVKEFEKLYEISNIGRVRSIGTYKYDFITKKTIYKEQLKYLKVITDKGYKKLHLSRNGKRYTKYIHRLVAEAFIPNPNNYKEVNHKDSNPSNNKIDNLEWCDRNYNIQYMMKHQQWLKELAEMRYELLKDIYYGIEIGYVKSFEDVRNLIKPHINMNE